jgi:RimJ/RimL family protein N-acetyltransferase
VPRIDLPSRLSDGVVTVRPLSHADVPAYAAAFREDPRLGAAVGYEHDPDERVAAQRVDGAADFAARGEGLEAAIADAGDNRFLGALYLVRFDWQHRRCELGFWLAPAERGRGVVRRASTLALDWAFNDLGMRRAELTTTPDNEGAQAVARSLGFTREGEMRARNFERGRAVDVVWYGLLREDWVGRA